jgi:hypothetical protein
MRISDILRGKGEQVVTVTPDTNVERLLAVLAEHKIGAVVVSAGAARWRASSASGTSCGRWPRAACQCWRRP